MAGSPSYEHPPVNEVVLAVAFDGTPNLTVAHLGHFWSTRLREALPAVEEQAPYFPPVETFGAPEALTINLQLLSGPPSPRLWARSADGTKLVQLQRGWMAFNWRDAPGSSGEYPRWPSIEEQFLKYYRQLAEFLTNEDLGRPVPTQCEVTYINNIPSGGAWRDHSELYKVLSVLKAPAGFLERPETTQVVAAFRMTDSLGAARGRLHIVAQPAFQASDHSPALVLTLTARGNPYDPEEGGVMSFMRLGHEWVVNGFTSATTEAMHHEWGRNA